MDYLYALQQLRETAPDFINQIFYYVSEYLSKAYILIPLVVYWCFSKAAGKWMIFSMSSGYFVNQTIKNTACIYRPWIRDSRLYVAKVAESGATGYSFPSGHTAITTLAFESLAVWQRKKKWVIAVSIFAVVLMAFTRNWLGAHTLADVITAMCVSSFVIIIDIFISRLVNKYDSRDYIFLIAGLLITLAVTLILQFKKYPLDFDAKGNLLADPYTMLTDCYTAAGMFSGFLAGWFLEKRTLNFSTECTVKTKVLRGLFGVVFAGLIYLILSLAFKKVEAHAGHFIKYFLLLFCGTFVYPLIFSLIESKKSKNQPEKETESLSR